MARQLPKDRRRDGADECVRQRRSSNRHDQVNGGEYEDLPGHAEKVQQHPRHTAQRPVASEKLDLFPTHSLQAAGDKGDQQQSEPEREDVAVGNHRRDEKVAPANSDTMMEDH